MLRNLLVVVTLALLVGAQAPEAARAQTTETVNTLCFNAAGAIVAPTGRRECAGNFQYQKTGVVARDLASGRPLYSFFTEGTKTRDGDRLPIYGLKDGDGRVVVPVSEGMTVFIPLTNNLVYAQKTWRYSFLVRVSDGRVRAIPYSRVIPAIAASGPPVLLARDYRRVNVQSNLAWILDVNGEETGGKLDHFPLTDYFVDTNWLSRLPFMVGGLIAVRDYAVPGGLRFVTTLGAPVAPGAAIYATDIGVLAPVAPGPRHAGHTGEPVYYGVVAPSGQIMPMAPGVKGITKLWLDWYIVRERAGRLTYERAFRPGAAPDLAGPPINAVFEDIAAQRAWVVGKTPRGWVEISGGWVGARLFATAEEGIAAKEAGWQAQLAEQEAARQRQLVAAATARHYAVDQLSVEVENAKRNRPTELALENLYTRMRALNVTEDEINTQGLARPPTEQERFCRSQPGGSCTGPRGEPAGSPSSSQWSGSTFDAMQYLRDQHTSNCAAASMGASRPCWQP